jgi:hypothetical protein
MPVCQHKLPFFRGTQELDEIHIFRVLEDLQGGLSGGGLVFSSKEIYPLNYLIFLFILFHSTQGFTASEAYSPMNLKEIDRPVYCMAPAQPFFEAKLRSSFKLESGEKELKEVVLDPRNYQDREEVKALGRQLKYAGRITRPLLLSRITPRFDQMIETTRRRETISNFPMQGASASMASSEDGTIMIEMTNLSTEGLDFLPPELKEKLGNSVKIHYLYPYDKFDYILSYEGKEMPMQMAFHRLQDQFEEVCLRNAVNGAFDRKKRNSDIKNASGGSAM